MLFSANPTPLMISIEHRATYYGANTFADEAVLVVELKLKEELLPGVNPLCNALRATYPDWPIQAPDSSLPPATRLALTMAQWALAALNAEQGYLHAAGAIPSPEGAYLWVGFHEAAVSHAALRLALDTLLHAERLSEQREKLRLALESLWQMCRQHHPNSNSQILMQAAASRGIPVLPYAHGTGSWQYGWGRRSRVFNGGAPNDNGFIGRQVARSKTATKTAFSALGLPVPAHRLVTKPADLEQAAAVGWPCVTKPMDKGMGRGVTAGIRTLSELRAGFAYAQQYTQGPIMVEAFLPGDDHRLMVVGGRLIAAIRREPPSVVGDGTSSVSALLDTLNKWRKSNAVAGHHLLQIRADAVLHQQLASQGLTLDAVPIAGRLVTLRSNANMSTGGTCFDVTDKVHPQVRRAAEMLAKSLDLSTMGLDYITPDISRPWDEVGGGFIETNPNPSLAVLIVAGFDPRRLGDQILGDLPGRIPLTLAVVPQQEIPAVQRWLQQMEWPSDTGWSCGEIGSIDGIPLRFATGNSWHAAAAVLRNRSAGVALIVCGDQDLMRHGMPGGRADTTLMCNVELPAQWQEVLLRHTFQIDQLPHWQGLASRIGTPSYHENSTSRIGD